MTQTVFDEGGETFTRSVVVRENLTPEQQWQRDLNTAERRFRWLFDDAPVGIALVDPDATVNVCNRAFADMVAEPAAEVAGRPIADFIHDRRPHRGGRAAQPGADGCEPRRASAGAPGRRAAELSATLYVSPTAEDGAPPAD